MKTRSAVLVTLITVLFAACSNNSQSEHVEKKTDSSGTATEETIPSLEDNFPTLYNFLHSQDSSFSMEGFQGGMSATRPDSSDSSQDTSRLDLFYPFLLFNSDSSKALDLVSYNYVAQVKNGKTELEEAGPDYEAALIDFRTGKRKQLLFFGTMGTVLDAKWLDQNTILMAGATEWIGDSMLPVIWKYEIPARSWSAFRYEKMIKADWSGYKQPSLKH
jgi:hypothetical protein